MNPDRLATTTLVLSLALALGGCASMTSPPDGTVAVDMPANWSVATAGARPVALDTWWSSFQDPVLGGLVTRALQSNTSIAGARAALRQARALRDVAAAGFLPSVGGTLSAQRSRANGSTGNSFRAGLDASWEPDLFGGQQATVAAAEASTASRAASLSDVQVSITAELALAYIDLRNAQARRLIAQDNLASQQETLQITQWRLQAGLVTSLDSEQARAAVASTQAQLPALQTRIEQSAHAIAVLTGQAPAALNALLGAPGAVPQPADDLALSLPADTLRQRPDVRGAEQDVAAALARVTQAEADRWPGFKLGGSLGLSALTLGALSNGASLAASLLASVSVPVFDGGAARAQVRAQQAALDQARVAWRASVLTALKDVEDALVALRGDRERLVQLQQAAEAAGIAAQLARQRYDSGLVDFQAVLETQRSQLSTQDSLATARADVSADHVRLFKALGGGWTPDALPSDKTTASCS